MIFEHFLIHKKTLIKKFDRFLEKRSEDCNGRLPSDRFGDRKETKSSQTNDSGQDTQVVICQRCQSAHLGRDFDLESDLDDDDDMSTTMEQGWMFLGTSLV